MSNYYRFFIKTPSRERVEQLIVHTLGGDAWLTTHGDGYLKPIKVVPVPGIDWQVLPERDQSGWPVTSKCETGWFWLESQIDFDSPEAAAVANALLAETKARYPLVEIIAVDTMADEEEFGPARIVENGNDLWYSSPD